jgi:hypothetical protein
VPRANTVRSDSREPPNDWQISCKRPEKTYVP